MQLVGTENDYRQYHPRVFDHPGPVLDIGCLNWSWSHMFKGKKRVIGFDPQEKHCPEWAELRNEVIGVSDGTTTLYNNDDPQQTSLFIKSESCKVIKTVSIESVVKEYGPLSICKLNIEGGEYPLLTTMVHPVADQLIISWHGWLKSGWGPLTNHMENWLSEYYDVIDICPRLNWKLYLCKR